MQLHMFICQHKVMIRFMENIPELSEAIASVVKKLRLKTGLTQAMFADFASLSTVYIAQLETGQRGASLNALMLIGRAVGLNGAAVVTLIEEEMERISQKNPNCP